MQRVFSTLLGERELLVTHTGLLTEGVLGVPQDPLALRRGPLGSSLVGTRHRKCARASIVPGPLVRRQDLQRALTELSPQVTHGCYGFFRPAGGDPGRATDRNLHFDLNHWTAPGIAVRGLPGRPVLRVRRRGLLLSEPPGAFKRP
jgi:hypothetical protein